MFNLSNIVYIVLIFYFVIYMYAIINKYGYSNTYIAVYIYLGILFIIYGYLYYSIYKSKKEDTDGNADGNKGVDNAFPDLQRFRFLLFPLPNQQTGAHHEGQKYTRNHARPGAEVGRGRGKVSGEKR